MWSLPLHRISPSRLTLIVSLLLVLWYVLNCKAKVGKVFGNQRYLWASQFFHSVSPLLPFKTEVLFDELESSKSVLFSLKNRGILGIFRCVAFRYPMRRQTSQKYFCSSAIVVWSNVRNKTAVINILNLHSFWLRLDVSYVLYIHFQKYLTDYQTFDQSVNQESSSYSISQSVIQSISHDRFESLLLKLCYVTLM